MTKSKQPKPPALKRWTKGNLTEADYAFAIAEKSGDCQATRLWKQAQAKHLVAQMLDWELFREFDGHDLPECGRPPFLDVPGNTARIDEALKSRPAPRDLPPLREVPLSGFNVWIQNHRPGLDTGTSFHAFAIQRYDDTEKTVDRFRKWLVEFKKTADRREWRADLKKNLAHRGRLSLDATLRALAARRLKLAGYDREEAQERLGLGKRAQNVKASKQQLSPDRWKKLVAIADREIQKLQNHLGNVLETA